MYVFYVYTYVYVSYTYVYVYIRVVFGTYYVYHVYVCVSCVWRCECGIFSWYISFEFLYSRFDLALPTDLRPLLAELAD